MTAKRRETEGERARRIAKLVSVKFDGRLISPAEFLSVVQPGSPWSHKSEIIYLLSEAVGYTPPKVAAYLQSCFGIITTPATIRKIIRDELTPKDADKTGKETIHQQATRIATRDGITKDVIPADLGQVVSIRRPTPIDPELLEADGAATPQAPADPAPASEPAKVAGKPALMDAKKIDRLDIRSPHFDPKAFAAKVQNAEAEAEAEVVRANRERRERLVAEGVIQVKATA